MNVFWWQVALRFDSFNRNYVLINADGKGFHGVLYNISIQNNDKPVNTSNQSMEL